MAILMVLGLAVPLVGCQSANTAVTASSPVSDRVIPAESASTQSASGSTGSITESSDMIEISLQIGSRNFSAMLYDNAATQALVSQFPLDIIMSDLNRNEKYYHMESSLPASAKSVDVIQTGDIMLYGADCLVVFYESFTTSYSYTRLGYIEDTTNLAACAGSGDVRVVFSLPA